ncbi:MAG TPA: hypothetical protein VNB90_13620 [Cytophagaceae bacterium]|jgi:hypothetical protein|nr:hypothetical protein [Cytophagaceae bacterium]
MLSKKVVFLVLSLLACTLSSMAQSTMPTRFVELGVSTNSYKGDLSHSYSQWANGIHIGILFNRKKLLNGHFNLMIGKATAQNPNYFFDDGSEPQPTPNNFARIKMYSLNYDLHLNLYKKHGFIVYLSQGIGLLRFVPKDEYNKNLQDQLDTRPIGESYSNIAIMLPTGFGMMYVSKPGFGIGLQAGWLNTQTDFLDNVSKWGNRDKKDNIAYYKMTVYIPFNIKTTATSVK